MNESEALRFPPSKEVVLNFRTIYEITNSHHQITSVVQQCADSIYYYKLVTILQVYLKST